ncbi:hypothetical protein BGZ83_009238 [Gryganskiella cystojenkinii]|nr:hypothetical protein BGZ83_009238 [Gryganskiella cystojenkinii]
MLLASKLPLPDECIDLILEYLVHDRITLHALVLSSQRLFQRAAPVLYRSPFRLVQNSSSLKASEKEVRISSLVALLLSTRSTDVLGGRSPYVIGATVPTTLTRTTRTASASALEATFANGTSIPTADTANINSDVHTCSSTTEPSTLVPRPLRVPELVPAPPIATTIARAVVATVDYLRFYTHHHEIDLCRPLGYLRANSSSVLGHKGLWIFDGEEDPDQPQQRPVTEFQTEITLALIEYRPQDIRVLGLPLIQIPLLLPTLEKLSSLVRLEISGIPPAKRANNFLLPANRIEPVLEFIRVHDALHHTLREIKIKGKDDQSNGGSVDQSHKDLVRLVQAMRTPEAVDARHWQEAMLVLDQIPVESLRSLLLGWSHQSSDRFVTVKTLVNTVSDYLQTCRQLKELRIAVNDEKMFRWAVHERQEMLLPFRKKGGMAVAVTDPFSRTHAVQRGIRPRTIARDPYESGGGGGGGIGPPEGLPPLRSLELCGENMYLIPAFIDAIDAFRETIESLCAVSLATNMSLIGSTMIHPDALEKISGMFITPTPTFAILQNNMKMLSSPSNNTMARSLTWSWPLTRLSTLDLEGEVAVAFDFQALEFCPNLLTLRLSLPPYLFSTSEDDQVLEEMTNRMPLLCQHGQNLLDLELREKWPVSDMLLGMIVRSMTRLTTLYIAHCFDHSFTNGVQPLIRDATRLQKLTISKWLCAPNVLNRQLQATKLLYPQLEVLEE